MQTKLAFNCKWTPFLSLALVLKACLFSSQEPVFNVIWAFLKPLNKTNHHTLSRSQRIWQCQSVAYKTMICKQIEFFMHGCVLHSRRLSFQVELLYHNILKVYTFPTSNDVQHANWGSFKDNHQSLRPGKRVFLKDCYGMHIKDKPWKPAF